MTMKIIKLANELYSKEPWVLKGFDEAIEEAELAERKALAWDFCVKQGEIPMLEDNGFHFCLTKKPENKWFHKKEPLEVVEAAMSQTEGKEGKL